MGRHVVGTFEDMIVIRLVFFDETVVYFGHVGTHIRVGVFVDGERTTRVFDKQVQQTGLRQRRKLFRNLPCDEVKTPRSST